MRPDESMIKVGDFGDKSVWQFEGTHMGMKRAKQRLDWLCYRHNTRPEVFWQAYDPATCPFPVNSGKGCLFGRFRIWQLAASQLFFVFDRRGRLETVADMGSGSRDGLCLVWHKVQSSLLNGVWFGACPHEVPAGYFDDVDRLVKKYMDGDGVYNGGCGFISQEVQMDCVKNFRRYVKSPDERDRYVAAILSSCVSADNCDIKRATEIMDGLAHDPSPRVRRGLAKNFMIPSSVVETLARDPDWRVRQTTCLFTGDAYGERANVMAELTRDPEYEVRISAAAAICWHAVVDSYRGAVRAMLDSPYDDDFKADVAVGIASGEYTDGNDEVTAYFMRRSYAMVNANVIGLASKHMGV